MEKSKSRNTPNMIRAQERKKKNHLQREAADAAEAAERGITVSELRARRHRAAAEIRKNHSSVETILASFDSRSRYGW